MHIPLEQTVWVKLTSKATVYFIDLITCLREKQSGEKDAHDIENFSPDELRIWNVFCNNPFALSGRYEDEEQNNYNFIKLKLYDVMFIFGPMLKSDAEFPFIDEDCFIGPVVHFTKPY